MNKYENIIKKCEDLELGFCKNAKMSSYTTFRIGGEVPLLISPKNDEELSKVLKMLDGVPFFVIGKGSNLLIDDEGIDAVCVLVSGDFANYEIVDDLIICDAGLSLTKLCTIAADNSLSGLEFAYGIPGTVGGGAYMNAGAYGGEMKDVITYCEHMDYSGNTHKLFNKELDYSYRHSYYTGKNVIITKVAVKLSKAPKDAIREKMLELFNRRHEKQPLEFPSAGSTFKRPVGAFAAALIEECSLKGERVGGAEVSTKHSGFIINRDNATCQDVLELIRKVKAVVKEKTGFDLQCEVMMIKSDGEKTYSVPAE